MRAVRGSSGSFIPASSATTEKENFSALTTFQESIFSHFRKACPLPSTLLVCSCLIGCPSPAQEHGPDKCRRRFLVRTSQKSSSVQFSNRTAFRALSMPNLDTTGCRSVSVTASSCRTTGDHHSHTLSKATSVLSDTTSTTPICYEPV